MDVPARKLSWQGSFALPAHFCSSSELREVLFLNPREVSFSFLRRSFLRLGGLGLYDRDDNRASHAFSTSSEAAGAWKLPEVVRTAERGDGLIEERLLCLRKHPE